MRSNRLLLTIIALAIVSATGHWYYRRANHQTLPTTTLVQNQPYSVKVTASKKEFQQGDAVRFSFRTLHNDQLADIYQEERVIHYVIASQNYHDFMHTYGPNVAGPGEFFIDHTFTEPGPYRLWMELVDTKKGKSEHHGETADLIAYVDLQVTGASTPTNPAQLATTKEVATEVGRLVMEHGPLVAGKPAPITLRVKDNQGKNIPVFAAEPAIYVMVGPQFDFFRHTHTQPALPDHSIALTETFPTAGQYLFWTEVYVQLEADSYTAIETPFLLTVTE